MLEMISSTSTIELTEEMVGAGALALADFGWDDESLEHAAARIFHSMIAAKPVRRFSSSVTKECVLQD